MRLDRPPVPHPEPTRRAIGVRMRAAARTGALVLALSAVPAVGSETRWWVLDTPSDYAKAESRGVVVRPDGALELGPRATFSDDDSLTTIWAIAVLADGSVALAGDRGRIHRWTARDGVKPWVRLAAGQVLSLLADGDGVIAGTGPEGLIYRIGARGDTARLALTGERYVWALAPAGKGAWFAATGTRGRVLRVDARGAQIAFDSDESNLVTMVPDGGSGVYVGGDSRGKVFHVPARGPARTVFDASEDEIRGLALAGGALYAAALSAPAVTSQVPGPDSDDEAPAAPAPARSAPAGAKTVVYRIVPDSVATTYWTSPQPYVFALLPVGDGVLAASGNRAGVYRLERPEGATLWLSAPEGQVTALATQGDAVLAATSNPAGLWRLGPGRSDRGEILSPALDARRVARFGRLLWRGAARGGRVELEARSGNTEPPDSTWSPWRGGTAPEEGVAMQAPAARYLQWKLVLAGGNPRIESVEASWREQNLPPRVDDVFISPQGQDVREGELVPRSEPITQVLPGGQRVEYSLTAPPNPRQLRELPVWARGLRTAEWRASDPNGDPLGYRLEVRAEGEAAWILLAEDLNVATWTFDTHALPDGRYRARVIATDRSGNPAGEERTAEAVSAPFSVDNTPPEVVSLEAKAESGAIRVTARAEDAVSTLSRFEIAIDGEDWRPVTPEGGFSDVRRLSIETTLKDVRPGAHSVGVRAVDAAGNASTRARLVSVTGK